ANIIFGAVIDETLRDEMKITVIATGFDKEIAELSTSTHAGATSAPPRYTRQPGDDLQRPTVNPNRTDDLDVPTFIRKKAD
ncbi:MAG: cell division protein FtsZ, partial [Pyrinomonadaceae bacterium]|nr:cell division protein FtsZ [Pyrinomonadaceae bacterium]